MKFSCDPKIFDFKTVAESIRDLCDIAPLECKDGNLCIQTVDTACVCLVDILCKPPLFVPEGTWEDAMVGLHLASFVKAFKFVKASANHMEFDIDTKDATTCCVGARDESGNRATQVSLKLVDTEASQLEIPDIDYQRVVRIESSVFKTIVQDMAAFSESIKLRCEGSRVRFSCDGDMGSVSMEMEHDGKEVCVEGHETFEATFSLKYLSTFCKASPLSKTTELMMCEEMPLCVGFAMGHGSFVRFYLAPKVDEDIEE